MAEKRTKKEQLENAADFWGRVGLASGLVALGLKVNAPQQPSNYVFEPAEAPVVHELDPGERPEWAVISPEDAGTAVSEFGALASEYLPISWALDRAYRYNPDPNLGLFAFLQPAYEPEYSLVDEDRFSDEFVNDLLAVIEQHGETIFSALALLANYQRASLQRAVKKLEDKEK